MLLKPRGLERGLKRELTREELQEIEYAYQALDYEKQGIVPVRAIKVALRAMGFPMKKADVLELLRKHGEDEGTREVDAATFTRIVGRSCARGQIARSYDCKSCHASHDTSMQAFCVHTLCQLALRQLGQHCTPHVAPCTGDKLSERTPMDDLRRAFQLFDAHGTGAIDIVALRKVNCSCTLAARAEALAAG